MIGKIDSIETREGDEVPAWAARWRSFRRTWRRVRDEDRAVREIDEGLLTQLLTALHVVSRLLPLYLFSAGAVVVVQLLFFDNLGSTIRIYGGSERLKTGVAAVELAEVLTQDFNRKAAIYRRGKRFESDANSPEPTASSGARLGKLVEDPTSLVIIQDGYRPNFADLRRRRQPGITPELAEVHSVDVRAVADLWDSYLHVLVAADPAGAPLVPSIEAVDPKSAIFVGQGAQAMLARRILCKYGVFASDEDAKKALDHSLVPGEKDRHLQEEKLTDVIAAVRARRIPVAFVLTSWTDVHELFAATSGQGQGGLQVLPIDRAEAIAAEIPFAEVSNLPWNLYQDRSSGAADGRPRPLPARPPGPAQGDREASKGLKTLRTQTILACTSHLADGVVTAILQAIYSRTDFKNLHLSPRPPTDQEFLFPMHDAANVFHKAGPAPGFITSPFIVGGLALILGQLLHISGQLRERKSNLRDRDSRLREQESQRFIRELQDLLASKNPPEAGPPGAPADHEADVLGAIHKRAVSDFACGRIGRDGYDRIKEYHQLLRQLLRPGNGRGAGPRSKIEEDLK